MASCKDKMIAAFGGQYDEKKIADIVDKVENTIIKKKMAKKFEADPDALMSELSVMAENEVVAAIVEKRNALLNTKAEIRATEFIDQFKSPATGIKALLGGTEMLAKGSGSSVDARGKAITKEFLGKLIYDLEQANVLHLFNSGTMDRQIAQELWEIKPNGKPGVSGNKQAQVIAEIIHKYQYGMIQRQNRSGAWIKALPGYIVRQSHAAERIRKAGFEKWKTFVLDKLDIEKTFGTADVDDFLKGAYEGLVSGMHYQAKGGGETDFNGFTFGFKGPSNLAKKMSRERLLHFKDADSWFQYNEMFGVSNIREAVVFGLERGARNAALLEKLGTNPTAMLERLVKKYKEKNKTNNKEFTRLGSESITNIMKELDGTTRMPGNITSAQIGSIIRMVQNMAKLGSAVVSSVSDIPFQVSEMRYQGHNILGAYGNAVTSLLRGRGNKEQQEIARLLGVGFDGIIGDIASRFSAHDNLPGTMAKYQQRFFKLNLMTWWNDSHKTGVALMMSNHLGHMNKVGFNQLDDATKRVFKLYDIGEKEWEIYRKHGVHKAADGNEYLLPEGVLKASDDEIIQYAGLSGKVHPDQIAKIRDELSTRLRTYFIDRVDHAVPHPGAIEHAALMRGTQPGTTLGEAMRFIMQFKSFPVTALRKGFGRELFGHGADSIKDALIGGKGDLLGLTHLMVGTTVFGYMAGAAKDALKGRTPRDPKDPKTVIAAMAQGGGLGIYGDFMFGEFSRYGRSALSTLAGPTFGQVDDLAEIYTRIRTGQDASANFMRTAMNNTPFINLFYTRSALDYMFLYQLQESVNPGYLRRLESRLKRENDQKFLVPPSKLIPRGGGDRLLEAIR